MVLGISGATGDIWATTTTLYADGIADNAYEDWQLMRELLKKKCRKPYSGGKLIEVPIQGRRNNTFQFFAGYDTLSTTSQAELLVAHYSPKSWKISFSVTEDEKADNSGKQQVTDLVKWKMTDAKDGVMQGMEDHMFSYPLSSSAAATKGIMTLPQMMFENTVGLINSTDADNAFWKANTASKALAATTKIDSMLVRQHQIRFQRGREYTDIAVMDKDAYIELEEDVYDKRRFNDAGDQQLGFTSLMLHGTKFMFAENTQLLNTFRSGNSQSVYSGATLAHAIYWLNSKYLELRTHRNMWAKKRGPVYNETKAADYYHYYYRGAFSCSNRSRQGFVGILAA